MGLHSMDLLALAAIFAGLASGVCALAVPFPPVLALAMLSCIVAGVFLGWALIKWSWGE